MDKPPRAETVRVPAATLILFRDGPNGSEHLFVERASTMSFAAGAAVFPGGSVEPGDYEFARRFPAIEDIEAASRIAAIRETIEEAGVAVGLTGDVDAVAIREGLARGEDFAALLDAAGTSIDLDALVPFARWYPSRKPGRAFDTRFYIARFDGDRADATVDETENVHLFWSTAKLIMARADQGELRIIFPTMCNIERIGLFGTFAEAAAHAATIPVEEINPWIEQREGERHICIPDHLGYPTRAKMLSKTSTG